MNERADELIGRMLLGRYRIVRKLARGGMGVIYLARSEGAAGFVKPVVIKRVVPDLVEDDSIVQMFVREAHILANLHHPGIVQVIDFAEEDDAYVMVLEYVRGYHLGRWYRYVRRTRGSFPTELALHIMVHVLDALHYAHTLEKPDGTPATVVHRDVSPSNMLLDTEGNIKLADFGIARMSNLNSQYRTESPSLKGKMSYLAPELFDGQPATTRADVYAAGVVLHELLSGSNAFYRKEVSETVMRVLSQPLPPVQGVRDDVPPGIDEALARATAKDPEERFPDAATFAAALRHLRSIPETEASALLTEQVREDFLGDLPEQAGIEPLEVLDAAWRQEPGSDPPAEAAPQRPSSSPPTMPARTPPRRAPRDAAAEEEIDVSVELPPSSSERDSGGRPRRAWLVGLAAAAVVLVGAGVAWGLVGSGDGGEKERGKQFILVEKGGDEGSAQGPGAGGEADRAMAAASSSTEPGGQEGSATGSEPDGDDSAGAQGDRPATGGGGAGSRPPSPPAGDPLTRAFAKQQPQVESCFANHADEIEGSPKIAVRFRLAASGAVQSAELLPGRLASTALGRCLLDAARGTDFPAQDEAVAFRIPITVQRR